MSNLLHILQHALGLDQHGQGTQFRNHFVAGGKDLEVCREAVAQGFMTEHAATCISGGQPWFSVTKAGVSHVASTSPSPPKLSRSQQRYRRFLQYRDGFDNFLHYCRWDANPDRSWNQA